MKNNWIRTLAVLAIILIAFTAIAFVIPFAKTGVFWLSYVFGIIALAVMGYSVYAGFVGGEPTRSKLYAVPIARLGLIYMIVQLVLSIVFMILSEQFYMWLPLIIYILLLCAAAIGLVAAEGVRAELDRQDVNLKEKVLVMHAIQSKVRTLASVCEDNEAAKAVKAFSEELQYSDPVSGDALSQIESELVSVVNEMQKAVSDGDFPAVISLCKKASATLAERNRLCKLTKK